MSKSNKQQQSRDKDLVAFGNKFLQEYAVAAAASNARSSGMEQGRSYAFGPGGLIELTDEVLQAQSDFVNHAAKLLKSKAAHERAISDIATKHAHEFVAGGKELENAVADMIQQVFEKGNAAFEYLAPNYLIRFDQGISDIQIGRVRAVQTSQFSAEWQERYPGHSVEIVAGSGFSLQLTPKRIITIRPVCWLVDVDAVKENVEEEGKWLIDVAVSYLRLTHKYRWPGHFPQIGDIEPNPLRETLLLRAGAKLQGSSIFTGESRVPPWYEIDGAVIATSQDTKFVSNAALIFDPPQSSLAARVSQGLGWLSRGRQAEDRSERLLNFFTAIESLLSNDDKTAPVVQNIARHAAVIVTNDTAERADVARDVKKLYSLRSALVHAGTRGVLWSAANGAQIIAERLFEVVLEKADLEVTHQTFCNELAAASYGTPWPSSSGSK